jgi:hypothetical protein
VDLYEAHNINDALAQRVGDEDMAIRSRNIDETVLETDPPLVEYEFAIDGNSIRVALDEDLTVHERAGTPS